MTELRLTPAPLSTQMFGLETTSSGREVTHFLALQEYVDPVDLEFLWQCRFPRAAWEVLPAERQVDGAVELTPGVLRVSARSVVHGPYLPLASLVDTADTMSASSQDTAPHPARFAHGTSMVWALTTIRERGEAPTAGGGDRDGLARIFAEGLPTREELRQVTALVALARYLGASAHLDAAQPPSTRAYRIENDQERYRSITPDPAANVDRIIYSDVWLDPAAALRIAQIALPSVQFMPTEVPWEGPEDPSRFLYREHMDITAEQIEAIHEAADQHDREALETANPVSAFGLVFEGRDGDIITVEIGGTDELPPALQGVDWAAAGVIEYRISWVPQDLEDWHREIPSFDLRKRRTRYIQMVRDLTKAFYSATSGEISDLDGFLHDPAQL